jgi:hypothetical protein
LVDVGGTASTASRQKLPWFLEFNGFSHQQRLCNICQLSESETTVSTLTIILTITEMISVYSAVRTGSLNTTVCSSSLKG